jgi:hypothetical protein
LTKSGQSDQHTILTMRKSLVGRDRFHSAQSEYLICEICCPFYGECKSSDCTIFICLNSITAYRSSSSLPATDGSP